VGWGKGKSEPSSLSRIITQRAHHALLLLLLLLVGGVGVLEAQLRPQVGDAHPLAEPRRTAGRQVAGSQLGGRRPGT
jgi:hypothetical protein